MYTPNTLLGRIFCLCWDFIHDGKSSLIRVNLAAGFILLFHDFNKFMLKMISSFQKEFVYTHTHTQMYIHKDLYIRVSEKSILGSNQYGSWWRNYYERQESAWKMWTLKYCASLTSTVSRTLNASMMPALKWGAEHWLDAGRHFLDFKKGKLGENLPIRRFPKRLKPPVFSCVDVLVATVPLAKRLPASSFLSLSFCLASCLNLRGTGS